MLCVLVQRAVLIFLCLTLACSRLKGMHFKNHYCDTTGLVCPLLCCMHDDLLRPDLCSCITKTAQISISGASRGSAQQPYILLSYAKYTVGQPRRSPKKSQWCKIPDDIKRAEQIYPSQWINCRECCLRIWMVKPFHHVVVQRDHDSKAQHPLQVNNLI